MQNLVMENGEELKLTKGQINKVKNIIYECPECNTYHINEGYTMNDIEYRTITKKEFKERCSFHTYTPCGRSGKKTNAIFFGWKMEINGDKRIVGYKYAVAGTTDNVSKKELFNVLYDWVVNEIQPPYYVRYKYAMNDEERFKVPLSLNF